MYEKYIVNPFVCVCACMYIILYMHATSIINLELPAHVHRPFISGKLP